MVPFGQGRRSRKSRARAVGAPARASRGCRSLGRVQAAVARVASRSAPRVHPLRPDSGIFGTKPRNGDPASRSRRGFFPGGARYSAPRAEAARRARGGGLRCGRGRGPLRAGPAPPSVGASRRPTPPPRRIPHRYAVSVLPARPRPLRLVARPFRAVPDGARSQALPGAAQSLAPSGRSRTALVRRRSPGRRIGAAAHTGRREDETRPEGERRSDGRGMRGGMRREREAGRAKAARKRAAGRPASRRVRARRALPAQSEGRAAARAAPRPTDGPPPIA